MAGGGGSGGWGRGGGGTESCPYSRRSKAKVILPSGYLPRQPGWPTQST